MKGTVLHGPGDIRYEDVPDPKIEKPTDAIIRIAATCVCGSDLWPYRGLSPGSGPTRMGHEYCGYVEEIGSAVTAIRKGQFVVGSFATSDNTCPTCHIGYQSSCMQREFVSQAQSPYLRVAHADGTLVATREAPDAAMLPGLLASSDVLGTGWYAADAAKVGPGATAVVVGDGAVGLLATLSAKRMGAERIIVMSRNAARQKLARDLGATDIVAERGEEGVGKILEMTRGVGADSVLECVGNAQSMQQAMQVTRRGGHMSFVGVPHGVEIEGQSLFFSHIHLEGGPAPVRRYLPDLIDLVLERKIDPSPVFDLVLPLEQVAEGYRAMDDRRAIKALLQP
jgi:threonine dehydrogenase-like Zn-dependent dehydrogenase